MDPLKQITLEQHVILRLPSNNCKIVELKANSSISLGKFGAFEVNDVIGYPLGTTFEIYYDGTLVPDPKNKTRIPVGKIRVMEHSPDDGTVDEDSGKEYREMLLKLASSANNKDLVNVGNSIQKLSMEEIEALKKQSVSGDEIIAKMIESHGSFHQKTAHSQEKYLNRKKQKFAKFFTVRYLGSSELLEYLLDKGDIQRVMGMSEESMGMLLNIANIRSNGHYLCMDETGGLLVYFLLERMFGGMVKADDCCTGSITVVHENEHPNLDLLKYCNYSDKFIKKHVKTLSLLEFFEPPSLESVKEGFLPLNKDEVWNMKASQKNAYYRRLKLYNAQLEMIKNATEVWYDGLVTATTLHLGTLIPRLSERVHGSRAIVCYSQFREPLLELAHVLYDDLRFLAPTVLETRCRPYQTIRGKLHPVMTMRGGGGYLLWSHRVIPATEP